MNQLQINFRSWLCASVVVASILFTGSLAAETKTENEAKPKLLHLYPDGVYANQDDFKYPLYEITVVGENLPSGKTLKIYLDDREARTEFVDEDTGTPPRKSPTGETAEDKIKQAPEVYRQDASDGSQLKLWINKNYSSGLVHLRIGAVVSPTSATTATPAPAPNSAAASPAPSAVAPLPVLKSNELRVTLAELSKGMGRWLFLGGTLLVALIVLALPVILVKRSGQTYNLPNNKKWLVAALFLDKETATYSLSKFQFYIWTAVSVMGYVYLVASRCIVQGLWEFRDIPKNLPAIVFISAATGALAQFVTAQRGPKGAGEEHPSYADFVSSGGIVVAERVQFFIWTIIGSMVFLWLIITQDPVTIRELPTVPEGFLQLMGISSFGYLAGKFARKPGPIIDDIKMERSSSDLIITLRGRILSPNATFKITYKAEEDKGPEQERILTGPLSPAAKVSEVDEQSKPDETGKILVLTFKNQDESLLKGACKFTISNPDGQSASWPFPDAAKAAPGPSGKANERPREGQAAENKAGET